MKCATSHLYCPHDITTVSKLKRQECQNCLKNDCFNDTSSLRILRQMASEFIDLQEIRHYGKFAHERDYKVLLLPSNNSDLQSMELLKAQIKRNIEKQYQQGVIIKTILERLMKEFKDQKENGNVMM